MAVGEVIGPRSLGADSLATCAGECLCCQGFEVTRKVTESVVVLQATKSSWTDTLTGRRRALVVRLARDGDRWMGEARLTDWRHNVAFFLAGALLGPVGVTGVALSALSRLWTENETRQLLAHLRSALADRAEDEAS